MNWSTNCSFGPPILVDEINIFGDELITQMTNKKSSNEEIKKCGFGFATPNLVCKFPHFFKTFPYHGYIL